MCGTFNGFQSQWSVQRNLPRMNEIHQTSQIVGNFSLLYSYLTKKKNQIWQMWATENVHFVMHSPQHIYTYIFPTSSLHISWFVKCTEKVQLISLFLLLSFCFFTEIQMLFFLLGQGLCLNWIDPNQQHQCFFAYLSRVWRAVCKRMIILFPFRKLFFKKKKERNVCGTPQLKKKPFCQIIVYVFWIVKSIKQKCHPPGPRNHAKILIIDSIFIGVRKSLPS